MTVPLSSTPDYDSTQYACEGFIVGKELKRVGLTLVVSVSISLTKQILFNNLKRKNRIALHKPHVIRVSLIEEKDD